MAMNQLLTYKNFLDPQICSQLNSWVVEGVNKGWLGYGLSRDMSWTHTKRFTTRNYSNLFNYPQIVFDVFDKITSCLEIKHLNKSVAGGGKNGVVVSYTLPGGDIHAHIDPPEPDGHVLRCNIMTQKADDGAELFIGGEKINVEVGELHCYLPSTVEHYVTEVKGNTPRILWMFGYQCSLEEFESIRRNYG